MARRTLTPATPAPAPAPAATNAPPRDPSLIAQSDPVWSANLILLRRHWKWAAISQFFYTFATLLAAPDVALSDVEDDLARSTALYLPRLIQRLLYTLTQDRKITIDNWQTALRKQYARRNPELNPIGPEPRIPSRESSPDPSTPGAEPDTEEGGKTESVEPFGVDGPNGVEGEPSAVLSTVDESRKPGEEKEEPDPQELKEEPTEEPEEEQTKDWLELPLLEKLDSLHLLIEWQFQNPNRLRTMMKDDDEGAEWRIEPIGYDAKTNAYWLIGSDRLWIQRAAPKPPRSTKRKRAAAPVKAKAKAPVVQDDDDESDRPQRSSKRTRTVPQANASSSRPTRSHKKKVVAADVAPATSGGGKGTRAAKLQANKKLDAQAKELAEFQRQAASLARSDARTTRQGRSQQQSSPSRMPPTTPRGTRASARLRGLEDEWQQIPDEWLNENTEAAQPNDKKKGKGKEKAVEEDSPKLPTTDERRTGLESDESSELSSLSDVDESVDKDEPEQQPVPSPSPVQENTRRTRSSKRSTVKSTDQRHSVEKESAHAAVGDSMQAEAHLVHPDGFIEWEAICVTLYEWEHIAERFEKATHYLEKALYKVLTQHIVPAVTAELKEAERKRHIEEAIVHRKRSSRIAIKESEKEEARMAEKKKAEESEKLARARRAETRMKKDDAEREKRENAREQRRIEREEREQRALAKQQRTKEGRSSADDRESTSTVTPAVNGTHSTSSIHLSRVATPSGSGVQTPDWILECEICHASGINIDDGKPMVSCGMCSKWQHITCHDLADMRQGRHKRNWDTQQFYCKRCRAKYANGTYAPGPPHQPYMSHQQQQQQQQYGWSSRPSSSNSAPQLQSHDVYSQSTSDVRFLPRQSLDGSAGYAQHYAQKAYPAPAPHARPPATNGALAFAHYPPEQRGFPSRSSPHVPQQAWGNGFSSTDNIAPRLPPAGQFLPQYGHGGSMYVSNGVSNGSLSGYQQGMSSPQVQAYGHGPERSMSSSSSGGWGSSNGYASNATVSATQTAAESLAYMHELANGRHGHGSVGWQHQQVGLPIPGVGVEHGHGYGAGYAEQHPRSAAPSYHYPSAT